MLCAFPPKRPPMSATLAPPPSPAAAPGPPPAPTRADASPRLLMTRAEFEAASDCPGTRVEWLGLTDETRGGQPLGLVWPRFGFDDDGSYAMANSRHGRIVMNLILLLGEQLDRDVWRMLTQDGEVGCPTGRHRFPDVVLAREPARYAPHPDGDEVVLLNPSVCFEVLSDSTESVDQRDKPADYLSVPDVTDYVVIDQRARRVWHRRRAAGAVPARWDVTRLEAADAVVRLAAPAATLPLTALYARVPVG